MPAGRARIVGVEPPIGQPIERHREAAGGDHAEQDADDSCQRKYDCRRNAIADSASDQAAIDRIDVDGKVRCDRFNRHAITAASSANGSANSVWLKRISSRKWRIVLNISLNLTQRHAQERDSRNAIANRH